MNGSGSRTKATSASEKKRETFRLSTRRTSAACMRARTHTCARGCVCVCVCACACACVRACACACVCACACACECACECACACACACAWVGSAGFERHRCDPKKACHLCSAHVREAGGAPLGLCLADGTVRASMVESARRTCTHTQSHKMRFVSMGRRIANICVHVHADRDSCRHKGSDNGTDIVRETP
eukprot:2901544-Pleurochrysis_carterae.AAC.1